MLKYCFLLFTFFNLSFGKYTKEDQMKDQYNDFLKIHNKHYSNHNEYQTHFEIFQENLARMKTYNNGEKTCKMYLTQYSDLTNDSKYDYDTCKEFIHYKKDNMLK
jgi:hypothetical protein